MTEPSISVARSFVTNIIFDRVNASVKSNGILLHNDLLLHQSVHLLLEEVALVSIVDLELLEVFLKIGDVLNDLLQNVIGRLSGVVLQSCALRA